MHVTAVTAVGSGGTTSESAAYDAAGAMTCRALTSASCANPTPTGQALTYDALRRLTAWQNGSSSSESYAYDGEGTRVWRQTTGGAWTTTTVAILGMEEVTTSSLGGAPTATRFYALPGGVTATRDRTGLVYEATDALGTPIAALDLASGITGEQLRAPYGQARYAAAASGGSGGLRTPYGFTGQREDTTPSGSSGLDDFNARMYDPVVGRFTSADDAQPGLGDPSGQDGYAYVGGRVESATDPTGHELALDARWVNMVSQAGSVDGAGGAIAGALLALLSLLSPTASQIGTGVIGGAIAGTNAVTAPASVTVTQGSNVSITLSPDGTITVTTTIPGSVDGGTSTVYAPGQTGYLDYIHAFDPPASASDLPLNQATDRPTTDSGTGSSSSVTGAGTTAGAGAGAGASAGSAAAAVGATAATGGVGGDGGEGPCGCGPSGGGGSNRTPKTLYRMGNASSPKIDNVRIGKDVFPDDSGQISPGGGGMSLFDAMNQQGKWWSLPEGTELPDGLQVVNDHGGHWQIEPSGTMNEDEYVNLLRQIEGWEKC